MPYSSVSEAEKKNSGLKKYSDKAKRGWLKSFNSCMEGGDDESKCFATAYSVANKVDGTKASESEPEEVEHNEKYAPIGPCMCCADECIARELLHIALDLQDDEPKIAMGLMDEVKALKLKARVLEFYKEMRGFQAELADFIGDLKDGVKNPRSLSNFPEIADFIGLEKQLRVGPLRHAYEPEQMIAEKMLQVVKADA